MSFLIYDLTLLGIFVVFLSIFLYIKRDKLQRDGLLLLYRTEWGIKLINHVGGTYKKTLRVLGYVSITTGYVLMAGMFYLAYNLIKIYLLRPDIVQLIKVPPIMPLIPYFPQIFRLESFLPEFNFTYWIVILAVIAITHEFAHGIFAAREKIKIKSTGFGFFPFFLPVFLAAFVELDEPKMAKKSKLAQMEILSAGTFANVLVAILFFGVMWLFFSLAFVPVGITPTDYSYGIVGLANITMINGVEITHPNAEQVANLTKEGVDNEIISNGKTYVAVKGIVKGYEEELIALYHDAPAIKENLVGAILEINGENIMSIDTLSKELEKYSPGEEVTIRLVVNGESREKTFVLGENPADSEKSYLGIGFSSSTRSGLIGKLYTTLSSFKDPHVYYEGIFGAAEFIYNLLWWLILIAVSVALVNMLPVGIFDGGRFFYLTIWGITKSEKIARRSFKFLTYFFLFLLLLIMVFWAIAFF